MRPVAFAVPGSLDTPTGGYRYDRRIIAELRALGHPVEVVTLPTAFPDPTAQDLDVAEELVAALPEGMPAIVDGLAFGVMDEAAPRLRRARPLIALVHHPLALETGLMAGRADVLRVSEAAALAHASAIVVTSPATATLVSKDYAVAPDLISVALPGVEHRGSAAATNRPADVLRFLSVGSLIPRKGHLDLVAALAGIKSLQWQAEIVGDPSFDPTHAAAIAAAISAAGLDDRMRLSGALDEAALAERYASADCYVLASHYEGYGMAYAEAMAAGLPVIGTTGAAEAIGDGGVVITPGDVATLSALLGRVVSEPAYREALRQRSVRRADHLPRWRDAALVFSRLVQSLG